MPSSYDRATVVAKRLGPSFGLACAIATFFMAAPPRGGNLVPSPDRPLLCSRSDGPLLAKALQTWYVNPNLSLAEHRSNIRASSAIDYPLTASRLSASYLP
jgi:hypothetical protein